MAHQPSWFAPGLFDGRVVLVTGGGTGIGRCSQHELASLGCDGGRRGHLARAFVRGATLRVDGGASLLPSTLAPVARPDAEHPPIPPWDGFHLARSLPDDWAGRT